MAGRFYAEVRWTIADIQSIRPNWTEDKCEQWLAENETKIQNRLVELGWEVMEILMEEDRYK